MISPSGKPRQLAPLRRGFLFTLAALSLLTMLAYHHGCLRLPRTTHSPMERETAEAGPARARSGRGFLYRRGGSGSASISSGS
jgi:hypothetical protein